MKDRQTVAEINAEIQERLDELWDGANEFYRWVTLSDLPENLVEEFEDELDEQFGEERAEKLRNISWARHGSRLLGALEPANIMGGDGQLILSGRRASRGRYGCHSFVTVTVTGQYSRRRFRSCCRGVEKRSLRGQLLAR